MDYRVPKQVLWRLELCIKGQNTHEMEYVVVGVGLLQCSSNEGLCVGLGGQHESTI